MAMWLLDKLCEVWWKLTKPSVPRLKVEALGFAVMRADSVVASCRWASISRVDAFKRDHGVYDEICLRFELDEGLVELEVSEAWTGCDTLIQGIKAHLPGSTDDWCETVAFPAFAQNHTVVFARR